VQSIEQPEVSAQVASHEPMVQPVVQLCDASVQLKPQPAARQMTPHDPPFAHDPPPPPSPASPKRESKS
jgi:hypothetical protein